MSSDDPNGTRWSSAADGYGKALLRKSGWREGGGLGKDGGGATTHVKVRRKDDTMGIGYTAAVQETWTTQSVGFADVLARIKRRTTTSSSNDDDDNKADADADDATATSSSMTPTGSKRHAMYAKRHALHTELLRAHDTRTQHTHEILGAAATTRADKNDDGHDGKAHTQRKCTQGGDDDERSASTLHSPLLRRLMVRCPEHEPRATTTNNSNDDDNDTPSNITITKPKPRPPRCTATPFCV